MFVSRLSNASADSAADVWLMGYTKWLTVASTGVTGSSGHGRDAMDSNLKQATDDAQHAITEAGERQIRARFEARGLCGAPEPDVPAPTMQRCNFPKNHQPETHSWQ
jgi:hypothetical protein